VIFEENPFLTLPKKLVAFIQNAVEAKLNMLEINFYMKHFSYDRHFTEVIEKMNSFGGVSLDN